MRRTASSGFVSFDLTLDMILLRVSLETLSVNVVGQFFFLLVCSPVFAGRPSAPRFDWTDPVGAVAFSGDMYEFERLPSSAKAVRLSANPAIQGRGSSSVLGTVLGHPPSLRFYGLKLPVTASRNRQRKLSFEHSPLVTPSVRAAKVLFVVYLVHASRSGYASSLWRAAILWRWPAGRSTP